MGMCFAPDCKHYSTKHECKFFRFPKDSTKKKLWIKLIRRERLPSSHSYVCSCHFVDGKKENNPTLFLHNATKRFNFNSLCQKRKKRKHSELPGPSTSCNLEDQGPYTSEVSNMGHGAEERSRNDATGAHSFHTKVGVLENEDVLVQDDSTLTEDQILSSQNQKPKKSSICVEADNYFLTQEINLLNSKIEKLSVSFTFRHIHNNEKRIRLYTGLPSEHIFLMLYDMMKNINLRYYLKWKVEKVEKIDQLLMTLMKLRLNMPHEDLACRFNVSGGTVTNIIITWIHALHCVLFKNLMATVPSRKKNKTCLPSAFNTFTNCRIILDCTEIFSVTPKSMAKQKATYSNYKGRNTWKGLVGVAPNGVVTFVSELYPGSISDKQVVQHSGVLKVLDSGDLVLADKGFLIQDILPSGVSLNIPPFLCAAQFTEEQAIQTETIARARVHVERAIGRMKCYNILDLLPASLLPFASCIFQLIGALTNLQYPLIQEVEEHYCVTD